MICELCPLVHRMTDLAFSVPLKWSTAYLLPKRLRCFLLSFLFFSYGIETFFFLALQMKGINVHGYYAAWDSLTKRNGVNGDHIFQYCMNQEKRVMFFLVVVLFVFVVNIYLLAKFTNNNKKILYLIPVFATTFLNLAKHTLVFIYKLGLD